MNEARVYQAANLLGALIATVGKDKPNEIKACEELTELQLTPEELREAFIIGRQAAALLLML